MKREEAKAAGLKYYSSGSPCKKGHIADRKVHNNECTECHREYITKWRERNKEHLQQYNINYYQDSDNFKRRQRYNSKRQKENPQLYNFYNAKRHASKLNATPKWLTVEQLEKIRQIYLTCPSGYHVDHIEPLQGENVCGLHVPWNLRHLPAEDNLKKGNKSPQLLNLDILSHHNII